MKTRLFLFVLCSFLWALAHMFFFKPSSILARQSVAVWSVQNSDAAYVVQYGVEQGVTFPWFVLGESLLAFAFFIGPAWKAIKESQSGQ